MNQTIAASHTYANKEPKNTKPTRSQIDNSGLCILSVLSAIRVPLLPPHLIPAPTATPQQIPDILRAIQMHWPFRSSSTEKKEKQTPTAPCIIAAHIPRFPNDVSSLNARARGPLPGIECSRGSPPRSPKPSCFPSWRSQTSTG